jgi:hypothetical protein
MKCFLVTPTGFPVWLLAATLSLFSCKKKDQASSNLTITGISADTVWPGKVITVNGSGFSITPSGNAVRLGQIPITEIVEATATTLKIKIPIADATANARLYVTVNGEETASPKNIILTNQLDWQKALGGSDQDYPYSLASTSDGGYLVAGAILSSDGDVTGHHGNYDFWVVRLKADRTIAWQKSYGGSGNDLAYSIAVLADGGCVVAGYSNSTNGDVHNNHGDYDFWIVRLNTGGDTLWTKSYGGTGADHGKSILPVSDGFLVLGYTNSSSSGDVGSTRGSNDLWLVKLDANGNLIRTTSMGGSSIDFGLSIAASADGGYLMAGRTLSNNGDITGNHGDYDYWIVKLNAAGNVVFNKTLGGSSTDVANSIIATPDGGAVVCGYSGSTDGDVTGNHGMDDFWMVKLNATGAIVWQKTLGGAYNDRGTAMAAAPGGGYIATGYSVSADGDVTGNHGAYDCWVVRVDGSGKVIWQKSLGGTDQDYGSAIMPVSNNGFIIAGYGYSTDGDVSNHHGSTDFWVFKLWD